MTVEKMKILFIGGTGRSGSTILGRVLNEAEGCFFVGELDRVWGQLVTQRNCVCGKPYSECEVWAPIFQHAFGGVQEDIAIKMMEFQRRLSKEFLQMVFRPAQWARQAWVREYIDMTERLYLAVRDVTGCRLLIDSSKGGSYNHFLSRIPSLSVYCLHLMRDPRGVVNTYNEFWRPRKREGFLKVVVPTLLGWDKAQILMEGWGRFLRGSAKYMQMRYEDFVAQPQAHARTIFDFADEPQLAATLPFKNERIISLHLAHITGGNAGSNRVGDIELKLSERYHTRLSRRDKFAAVALTFPVMIRHGYLFGAREPKRMGESAS
ncbi:MAG: hypothetical protein SGI73_22880 [Chloroflexota bacterium]|nr:hypothetical protein [Chloroflexota bacterium]